SPQPRPFRPQVELLEDRLAPAVITVNTVDDNDVRDKEGNLTLGEAILLTNGTLAKKALTNKERNQVQGMTGRPGIEDTIKFDIANRQRTIFPTANLPAIVHSVIIDGRPPQGKPMQSIVLDGSKAGKSVSGLVLWETASASEVKGLRIQKFD